jgi:hypothetical protein
MKEQDYNHLITTFSGYLAPINQLLYEILVIITLYIFIRRIPTNGEYMSRNSLSVIIIFAILAMGIDWLIWCNPTQTILFGAILMIYIRYNMNSLQLISGFINMTGEYAEQYQLSRDTITKECDAPRIPEMVDLPYDTMVIKPYGIMAYDKTTASTNEIHNAYQQGQPPATITDSNYARIMLNELYKTPQYRNNHPANQINSSLDPNILTSSF